jgi:hypothetical protein
MLKKLHVYARPEHPHQAQKPRALDLRKVAAPHSPEQAHTIEEVTGA